MATQLPTRSTPDLASLANLFLGKETNTTDSGTSQNSGGVTTTGTRTNTTAVSQAAIDATVKSILEGSQGLAAVSSGQNRAGLYNSSTNRMLINDLIARASAEGAKLNKVETVAVNETQADTRATTKASTQKQKVEPQISPKAGLGAAAGLSIVSKLAGTDIGKKLVGSIFGSKTAGANSGGSNAGPTEEDVRAFNESRGGSTDNSNVNSTPSVAADGSPAVGSINRVGSLGVGGQSVGSNEVDVGSMMADMETVSPGFDDVISNDDVSGGMGDLSFDPTNDAFTGFNDIGNDIGGDIINSDWSPDGSPGDWGPDPSTIFEGSGVENMNDFDISQLFDFAEGGLVTKDGNKRLIDRITDYAGGRKIDDGEGPKETPAKAQKTSAPDESSDAPKKSMATKLFDYINNRGGKPGFASGGLVDITNTGLRPKGTDAGTPLAAGPGDQSVYGVVGNRSDRNQSGSGASGSGKSVNRPTGGTSSGTRATNLAGARIVTDRKRDPLDMTRGSGGDGNSGGVAADAASPGVGAGSGIGVSGAGIAGGIVGGLTGTPGLGSVTGLASASNNNQAVASVVGALAATVTANPLIGLVASSVVSGMSSSNSDAVADTANAVSAINDTDPIDALIGIIDANLNGANTAATNSSGVNASDGSGVGSSDGSGVGTGGGDSTGGGSGAGDSAGAGAGTGAGGLASGGSVRGKGTSTSDSIDAQLSDGEYVLNAEAVKALGVETLDFINNQYQPSPKALAQGERLQRMQRGK
jgi:hypothetical protein